MKNGVSGFNQSWFIIWGLRVKFSGTVLAWHIQGPEFKTQHCPLPRKKDNLPFYVEQWRQENYYMGNQLCLTQVHTCENVNTIFLCTCHSHFSLKVGPVLFCIRKPCLRWVSWFPPKSSNITDGTYIAW